VFGLTPHFHTIFADVAVSPPERYSTYGPMMALAELLLYMRSNELVTVRLKGGAEKPTGNVIGAIRLYPFPPATHKVLLPVTVPHCMRISPGSTVHPEDAFEYPRPRLIKAE
jgi:hypothetical protein